MAAGFGFDPQTFAPTYRLNYGSPGSSLALEIATRLGMPAEIIAQARTHRSERESQLADHLARVERDLQSLEHDRRLAARERQTLEETAAKLHAREHELRHREETFRKRLDERIEERLRDARREIDARRRGAEGKDRQARVRSRTAFGAADSRRARPAAHAPRRAPRSMRSASGCVRRRPSRRPRRRRSRRRPARPPPATASSSARSASKVSSRACTTAARRWTSAASGFAPSSTDLRVVTTAAAAAAQPSRVRVNVDLQPRASASVSRAEPDWQQRRRGADPPRTVPRRDADHRDEDAPHRPRLRDRAAAPRGRGLPQDASAGRRASGRRRRTRAPAARPSWS